MKRNAVRILLPGVMLAVMSLTPVYSLASSQDAPAAEAGVEKKAISGFRNWSWGSALNDIVIKVCSPDLLNANPNPEQLINQTYKVYELSLSNASLAGYSVQASYLFQESRLIGGGYSGFTQLSVPEYDVMRDLLDKYTDVYGEPVKKSDDGSKKLYALWVDDSGNFIQIGTGKGIRYGEYASCYLDLNEETRAIRTMLDNLSNYEGI